MKLYSRPKTSYPALDVVDVMWMENGGMVGEVPSSLRDGLYGKGGTVFYIDKKDLGDFLSMLIGEKGLKFLLKSYRRSEMYSATVIVEYLEEVEKAIEKKQKEAELAAQVVEKEEPKKLSKTKQKPQVQEETNAQQDESDSF